jgi:hypothetical protein
MKRISILINVLVITALALASLAPQAYRSATAQSIDPSASSGQLRALLRLPQGNPLPRLSELGVNVLQAQDGTALVLATADQLEKLVRLGFVPLFTDDLGSLVQAHAGEQPWLAESLAPAIDQSRLDYAAWEASQSSQVTATTSDALPARSYELPAIVLSPEQTAAVTSLTSLDDDGDGLTNTQEQWWCTDPLNADSDSDGAQDGVEVQSAKNWLGNLAASYPSTGKPFAGWPTSHPGCNDDDYDSVPDQAERWELGLNMNLESTDRDKFDDGQELFGNTNCPGSGGYCGYGLLPRNEDWGTIIAQMPSWVEAPGNHPLVAAFPVPEIDVVPGSLRVTTATTVTTDHTIASGTEKSYSTAKTEGTGTSISNATTWNEWEEITEQRPLNDTHTSTTIIQSDLSAQSSSTVIPIKINASTTNKYTDNSVVNYTDVFNLPSVQGSSGPSLASVPRTFLDIIGAPQEAHKIGLGYQDIVRDYALMIQTQGWNPLKWDYQKAEWTNLDYEIERCKVDSNNTSCSDRARRRIIENAQLTQAVSALDASERINLAGYSGQIRITEPDGYYSYRVEPMMVSVNVNQIPTRSHAKGSSTGGWQETTTSNYEEQTITNSEAFSSSQSWGNATAIDSAHTANLRFTYKVRNAGTEYARDICDLSFNVYIGDDSNPAITYSVSGQVGGCYQNFMPTEEHTYTSNPIPLSLEQMKAIDLGGPVRVVVEDFTYGIDEPFYQDASNSGLLIVMEDGLDDGDEVLQPFLLPIWGDETVLDVLSRYFPHSVDESDSLTAIWTPEYRADTPSWCIEPNRTGGTLWCKHSISTADWWNVYTKGLGDGTEGFQDTPANPGGVALFRFLSDADLDGYSDRSEARLGTDPDDPANFPMPELLAGLHQTFLSNNVVATLSLLNTGLYDAYGVEAVMVAPNDSITITNNTVGGSGRVKAGRQVVVGSRILLQDPLPAAWTGAGHAKPVTGGYYTGTTDRTYTFTVSCGTTGGCTVGSGTWGLVWNDGTNSGSLSLGSGYASPNLLSVGGDGLKIGMLSGTVLNNEQYTVQASTPIESFQYTINRIPHAEPVVIVSYNDPQGNHRFVIPSAAMSLGTPEADLLAYSGEMLPDVGVEIVTDGPFVVGANTTDLVLNNPSGQDFADAHLFLEFIDLDGVAVSEVPVTADVQAGPEVVGVTWDTAGFDPAYDPEQDYIVIAFWTDNQGNILDTAARPLSSFQEDPRPESAMAATDETWNFGTAQQGTLMQRQVTLGSVGYMDLLTYLENSSGLAVEGPASLPIGPADTAVYTLTVNTQSLPVGAYSTAIEVRTNDPQHATRTITVQGDVTAMPEDAEGGAIIRPLDWRLNVTGTHNAGEWVAYTHTLGPNPQTLHPVKVYSQDYATLMGVGKYATDFGQGTASYDMFGDGRDGAWTISSNTTFSPIDSSCYGTSGSYTLMATNGSFAAGQKILIHQSRGTGAGQWEINQIATYSTGTITTVSPLKYTYIDSGASQAQALVLKQYTYVTINSGVTLTAKAWDGNVGGILAFLSSGEVIVNGVISSVAKGFIGTYGLTPSGNRPGVQGEGIAGSGGTQSILANGSGGGGGNVDGNARAGGGGGGHVNTGGSGQAKGSVSGGNGGNTSGLNDFSLMTFGGAGGSGGTDANEAGGKGGNGSGIIVIYTNLLTVTGAITSNGEIAPNTNPAGAGGGGAGGSILIKTNNVSIGNGLVTAIGGSGGTAASNDGGYGGQGSVGRIKIEYCNTPTGTSNPPAITLKLSCYIAEQSETLPYDQGRLNLPLPTPPELPYQIQYGRRYQFGSGGGTQTYSISMPKKIYSDSEIQAMVSNTGVSSGALNLQIDVGNNGTWDWTHNASTNFPAALEVTGIVNALNNYMVSQSAVPWDADIDVPFKVQIDRQADVMLTDLQLSLQFNQPLGIEQLTSVDTTADRPLDWTETIVGSYTQGQQYDFNHPIGPDPVSVHPCKIFDQSGYSLKGVGKYCSDYGGGTEPYQVFGNGQDLDLTVNTGQTYRPDTIRVPLASSASNGQPNIIIPNNPGFQNGYEILIIQMQGTGAGSYEFASIKSIIGSTITLSKNLTNNYTVGGSSKAQVIRVPQFSNVTVRNGGVISAYDWDGSTGGIVAIKVSGKILVEAGGGIDTSGQGFIGGTSSYGRAPGNGEDGKQGEGTSGPGGSYSKYPNGNGGGGGIGNEGGDGGGGGGNGTDGTPGNTRGGIGNGGQGGSTSGNPTLTNIAFGGGGGSGGGEANSNSSSVSGAGGRGGGIIIVFSRYVEVNGIIYSNGMAGGNATRVEEGSGGGGGGAGGSIYLKGQSISIGSNRILASGASGGAKGNIPSGDGGAGGNGRIFIEYQNLATGWTTYPVAITQQTNFYIAEQLNQSPYTTTRLYIPEQVTNGVSYLVQYGRRFSFGGSGNQASYLRMNRELLGAATLDVLVSNTGVSSGALTLSLDIGNNGTNDWTHSATTTFPATLQVTGLQTAINNYLLSRSDIAWGSPVDVPVKVTIDRVADVMLTNLALTPSGAKTRFLRLKAGSYNEVKLSLKFLQPGVSSGPLSFTLDVGTDGTTDWSYSGSPTFPAVIWSPDLDTAFNSYLTGRTGEVDVPLRIVPSPYLETWLEGMTALPGGSVDASLGSGDISFSAGSPTEGAVVNVTALLHNGGSRLSGRLTAAFFATAGGDEWYIGSDFVEDIPAGGTANAVLSWNTLGFSGNTPVRVEIDPYNRLPESSESNNQAIKSLTILTRPDLYASGLSLAEPEPLNGMPVDVSLVLNNGGQTAAGTSTLSLYDGDPGNGGALIGESALSLGAGANQALQFAWTPNGLGMHRLFVQADREGAVNESDEGDNLSWLDVYVGLPGPVLLDSGAAGETTYSDAQGYGYLDEGQADALQSCGGGSTAAETLRRDPLGTVVYQFNHLQPGHYYHLDLTLYECDGAGRQESVYIDGLQVAGPVDLGDKQLHRLSLLVDPAFYADHLLRVEIKSPGIDGAVVSEVNLHDIDYRYADAGGGKDPQYPGTKAYGWLDGTASTSWGTLPYQSVRVDQSDKSLSYQFDDLNPAKSYKLNLVFWQPSGNGRILNVNIDGAFSGLTVDTWDYKRHQEQLAVPFGAYQTDGSIQVTVERTDAASGAMVNEISLEEETLPAGSACAASVTPYFSQAYGDVLVSGLGADPGTVVQALNTRGETVGCFSVGTGGQYGFMRLYGEDTSVNPVIPGLRDGELVIFKVNGATAVSSPLLYWHDDRASHEVDLNAGGTMNQAILMQPGWNLFSINVEPPYPLVDLVLSSIKLRYDSVLGEERSYSPNLEPQYNTLKELHSQKGYYLHLTHPASTNLLVEGVPQAADTPISLHQGWNWLGYLPDSILPIEEALVSINGQYQLVHSLDKTYDPDLPAYSTLHEMTPGQGYLIYMSSAATLTYPVAGGSAAIEPTSQAGASVCGGVQATPNFTVIFGQVEVNGAPAKPGAWVEAVTPRGEVAGCGVITEAGTLAFTHVYGTDSYGTPGFNAGELVTFRINGLPAASSTVVTWQDDLVSHPVELSGVVFDLYLPVITR